MGRDSTSMTAGMLRPVDSQTRGFSYFRTGAIPPSFESIFGHCRKADLSAGGHREDKPIQLTAGPFSFSLHRLAKMVRRSLPSANRIVPK